MQYSKIALAVMLTAAATAVSATDIQIYGRVDAGLMFEDADGGERSLTMKSGGRTSSRLGFNTKEDLGNGNFVKVYLENGFKVDDGSFSTADTLFDRRAILAVQGAWGELGLGRAGTVQSTAAPYSMGSIKWDVFGTSYSNSSIGTTFANSSRVDNAINYVSPVMNNLKFGLSYSTGDKDDDDANEWQDKGHTFAAAMNYIGDNLFLGVTFANVDNKHPGGTAADGRAYQVGGWYRVVPTVRIFAGAGYQTAWSTGAKLAATKATAVTADQKGGWDGYSLALGFEHLFGPHKTLIGAQYFDGELANNSDVDFKRAVYGAAYEYSFAKNVIAYVAVNYSDASGAGSKVDDASAKDTVQGFLGMSYLF